MKLCKTAQILEQHLRTVAKLPYIAVDEAKRALFAGAKLRSFHFVIYCKGINWLVDCAKPTKENRSDDKQWQDIFGPGFKMMLCSENPKAPHGLVFRDLDGKIHTMAELTASGPDRLIPAAYETVQPVKQIAHPVPTSKPCPKTIAEISSRLDCGPQLSMW